MLDDSIARQTVQRHIAAIQMVPIAKLSLTNNKIKSKLWRLNFCLFSDKFVFIFNVLMSSCWACSK